MANNKANQIVERLKEEYESADADFKYYEKEVIKFTGGEAQKIAARKRDVFERERAVWSKALQIAKEIAK